MGNVSAVCRGCRGCREVSVRRWDWFFRIIMWAGKEVKLATEGKPRTGPQMRKEDCLTAVTWGKRIGRGICSYALRDLSFRCEETLLHWALISSHSCYNLKYSEDYKNNPNVH